MIKIDHSIWFVLVTVIHSRMSTLLIVWLLTNAVQLIGAQEPAEIDIRVSGACSAVYLSRRNINVDKYRPQIRFDPDKIILKPKNPIIPGCIMIQARGVEIVRPIKNLVAEIEMRIGGTPDPNQPTLPCSKKIDDKVNQCPCAKLEGSCVFCDFCRQMKNQTSHFEIKPSTESARHSALNDSCQCEVIQPGFYDIETEMCTPELDDIKDYIPSEIQNNIVEKRLISMFITIYLLDVEQNLKESYNSEFGKKLLRKRMSDATKGCFLMGVDVKTLSPSV